jgi:hypothetical protein
MFKLLMSFILDLHTFGAFPGRPAIMRPDRFNRRRCLHTAHGRLVIRGVCTIQRWRGPDVCSCHVVWVPLSGQPRYSQGLTD